VRERRQADLVVAQALRDGGQVHEPPEPRPPEVEAGAHLALIGAIPGEAHHHDAWVAARHDDGANVCRALRGP